MIEKPATAVQAAFSRDTLAKAVYSKTFDYIVKKVNEAIAKPNFEGVQIGVLDIYGATPTHAHTHTHTHNV